MSTFYSPNGNPEVWESKPEGYYTPEEWAALHPPPTPTLEEVRESKMAEMQSSFNRRVSGSVTTTGGYKMQFDTSDAIKMEGAIKLLEATGATEGYLTQVDDTSVYNVPIDVMKAVLIEMMTAFAACHARKQELRAAINAANTTEELAAIKIAWPV